MNPALLWATTAVLGAVATLLPGIGTIIIVLLATPLIIRGDHRVAISGLLMGFGAVWLLWLTRQFSTGGTLDNSAGWIGVGVVPLAIGLALLTVAARRRAATDLGAPPGGGLR